MISALLWKKFFSNEWIKDLTSQSNTLERHARRINSIQMPKIHDYVLQKRYAVFIWPRNIYSIRNIGKHKCAIKYGIRNIGKHKCAIKYGPWTL
jgi:hypothetical protein